MKRSVLKSWCLAGSIFAVPAQVLAVWPPSTSLEEESNSPAASEPAEMTLKASPPSAVVIDKLEADERRLQTILRDLIEDERALKRLGTTPKATPEGSIH